MEKWRVKNAGGADGSVAFYHNNEPMQFVMKGGYVEIDFDDMDRDSAMDFRKTLAREGLVQEISEVKAVEISDNKVPRKDKGNNKVPRVETPEPEPIRGEVLRSAEEVAGEKAFWTLRHPDAQEDSGPDAEAEIPVDGRAVKVTMKGGRVETDDLALKEYLLKSGYTLVHTEPKE